MLALSSTAAFRNPAAPKLLLGNVYFYTHISAFFYLLNLDAVTVTRTKCRDSLDQT